MDVFPFLEHTSSSPPAVKSSAPKSQAKTSSGFGFGQVLAREVNSRPQVNKQGGSAGRAAAKTAAQTAAATVAQTAERTNDTGKAVESDFSAQPAEGKERAQVTEAQTPQVQTPQVQTPQVQTVGVQAQGIDAQAIVLQALVAAQDKKVIPLTGEGQMGMVEPAQLALQLKMEAPNGGLQIPIGESPGEGSQLSSSPPAALAEQARLAEALTQEQGKVPGWGTSTEMQNASGIDISALTQQVEPEVLPQAAAQLQGEAQPAARSDGLDSAAGTDATLRQQSANDAVIFQGKQFEAVKAVDVSLAGKQAEVQPKAVDGGAAQVQGKQGEVRTSLETLVSGEKAVFVPVEGQQSSGESEGTMEAGAEIVSGAASAGEVDSGRSLIAHKATKPVAGSQMAAAEQTQSQLGADALKNPPAELKPAVSTEGTGAGKLVNPTPTLEQTESAAADVKPKSAGSGLEMTDRASLLTSTATTYSSEVHTRTAETRSTQNILQQTFAHLEEMMKSGQKTLRVQVYPENLGHLELRLTSQNGSLQVLLLADSSTTQQTLERHAGDLQQALINSGVNLSGLTVGQRDAAQQQTPGEPQNNTNAGKHAPYTAGSGEEDTQVSTPVETVVYRSPYSSLDYRV